MEAAYILVQEHLLEGLAALKEECKVSVRQQEVLMHSDMDQILNTRRQLEEKIRGNRAACSTRLRDSAGSVLMPDSFLQPRSLRRRSSCAPSPSSPSWARFWRS